MQTRLSRAGSSFSSGATHDWTRSWRRSEKSIPAAQKMDESRGTRMRAMESSRAIAAACTGPAPPATTSGKARGSWPRSTVTWRMPAAMLALITSNIPAAASSTERPIGAASVDSARRAASGSSGSRPPRK